MKAVIRADASVDIGTGHVMRCLTLADYLRAAGADVSFVCRELPGNMCAFIEAKGFKVHRLKGVERLPEGAGLYEKWLGVSLQRDAEDTLPFVKKEPPADWLIIDHYSLDKRWEDALRPFVKKVMVIDDLADKPHGCDLLLNQNPCDRIEGRYDHLIPKGCKRLLGPGYVLLRPEFIKLRKKARRRDGHIRRILVFFGGSDPTNETMKALRAISSLNRKDISVDAVAGGSNVRKKDIEEFCSSMPNASFYCQTDDMARLMSEADLSIGAGGTATWERCCLGLPALVVITAENQAEIAEGLDKKGAIINLGRWSGVTEGDVRRKLLDLLGDPGSVKAISASAGKIADGSGIDIVLNELESADC